MRSVGVLEVNGVKLTDGMKTEVSDLFIKAVQNEGLLKKVIAEKLDINAPELSFIKSKVTWHYVKESTWFKFIDWRRSGEKLTDYINKNNCRTVSEIATDQIPSAVKQGLEADVKKLSREESIEKDMQSLLEKGELKIQDDDDIREVQFRQKMKECWDELEKRGTVGKFLRSRGYSGKLTKERFTGL